MTKIAYETTHLWVDGDNNIMLHANTHSVKVGKAKSIEQAKRFCDKVEASSVSVKNLKAMYGVL